MKATGIVRRIDELGRVVVPKEIRRTLRIREGDPLEIFTNRDGEVILKKYSPIGELDNFAKQYAEALGQTSGQMIMIWDRDQVVAASGGAKKENIGKKISKDVENLIDEREVFTTHNSLKKGIAIIEEGEEPSMGEVIYPIICEGDAVGAVAIIGKDIKNPISVTEQKLAAVAANFLGKQMES